MHRLHSDTLRVRPGNHRKTGLSVPADDQLRSRTAAPVIKQTPTRSPKKLRILVVHGSSITRLGLVTLFNRHRRFSLCAETAEAPTACELVVRHRPDAIIVGLTLRHGDGIELLKALRKESPGVRILVLTQRNDAISVQRAFRAGARGYLLVQDDIAEIPRALSEILAGGYYVSPNVAQRLPVMLAKGEITSSVTELSRLSDRELQVFRLIAGGVGASRVASELHLSVKTIETHRTRIKLKLGLRSGADLNRLAARWLTRMTV
jgi:DNA-binding NarL/FixJ family response regulator